MRNVVSSGLDVVSSWEMWFHLVRNWFGCGSSGLQPWFGRPSGLIWFDLVSSWEMWFHLVWNGFIVKNVVSSGLNVVSS